MPLCIQHFVGLGIVNSQVLVSGSSHVTIVIFSLRADAPFFVIGLDLEVNVKCYRI